MAISDYTRVNWKDGSGNGTPISAENLNKMDAQIEALTAAVQALQARPQTYVLTEVPDSSYGNDGDSAVILVSE